MGNRWVSAVIERQAGWAVRLFFWERRAGGGGCPKTSHACSLAIPQVKIPELPDTIETSLYM
jgi:hypothetical protein